MKYREQYGSKDDFIAYVELVGKVRKINPEAAAYLESKELRKIGGCGFDYYGDLSFVMDWKYTPQGHSFWQKIADKFVHAWAEYRFNARQSKSAAGKNAVMEF
jgi:hypothetical protein